MPIFRDTVAMTANGTATPLQDDTWNYRVLPWPARIGFASICTDANVLQQVTVGSDVQLQESPVPAGGTAGQFPTEVAQFQEFFGDPGDEIVVKYRETAGGTPSVMTVIMVEPL